MYASEALVEGRGLVTVQVEGIGCAMGPPARDMTLVDVGIAEVRSVRVVRMMVRVSMLIDGVGCSSTGSSTVLWWYWLKL